MIVINLFGGPGVGKSTTASGLFSLMKKQYLNVELVTEYAKDLTWEKRHNILQDQIYITAKQNRRLSRLLDHEVDFVVTDCPLLTALMYTPKEYYPSYTPLVKEIFNSYNNINYILARQKKYVTTGRNQTLEQAIQIDLDIEQFLGYNNIPYKIVRDEHEILKDIFNENTSFSRLAHTST